MNVNLPRGIGAMMVKHLKVGPIFLGLAFAAIGFSYSIAERPAARVIFIAGGSVGADNGQLRFTNTFVNNPASPFHAVPPDSAHPSNHADPTIYPNGGDVTIDPDGFDLGDMEYSLNVPPGNPRIININRHITAAGGVPPYQFKSASLPLPDPLSTLQIDPSGVLRGSIRSLQGNNLGIPDSNPTDDYISLLLEVTDSVGNKRTGNFYLFLHPTGGGFDISDTVIPNGDVGMSYTARLETVQAEETETGSPVLPDRDKPLGGKVSIVANDGNHSLSRFYQGAPIDPAPHAPVRVYRDDEPANPGPFQFARLEDIGLSMSYEGTIYGRPIFSGRIEIDVLAFDGRVFPAPTPQFVERTITMRVAANDKFAINSTYNVGQISSDLSIQSVIIRTEDTPTEENHSFTMSALFNPNSQFAKTLRRQRHFHLRFGNMEFEVPDMRDEPVGFTVAGDPNDVPNDPRPSVLPTSGTKISVSINSILGRLKVDVQNSRFTWPFSGLLVPQNNPKRLAIGVGIGHMWQTAEVIQLENRRSGVRSLLQYKLGNTPHVAGASGKVGTVDRSLGGTFLLTTIRGKDGNDVAGDPGSSWFVNGIAAPRLTLDNPSSIAVNNVDIVQLPSGGGSTSGIDSLNAARVRIGNWSQSFSSRDTQAKIKSSPVMTIVKFPSLTTGIQLLLLDNKRFRFKLVTQPIAGVLGFPQTGIPQGTAGDTANFPFGLDIFRTSPSITPNTAFDFHGENGRAIEGDVRQWYERPPGAGQ